MKTIVIFGGCGYIAIHFVEYLKKKNLYKKFYIIDFKEPSNSYLKSKFVKLKKNNNFKFINADVRKNLSHIKIEGKINLIVDCAAIHREPGHKHQEYFETNVNGSKNIIKFAKLHKCKNIIFLSSISVYGVGDHEKKEFSFTNPYSSYGKSKLLAEQNYKKWQSQKPLTNILTICRPGVVFGPGETGNVTRLIKALNNNRFLYLGNKNIKKAGIYIKELVNQLNWVNMNQIKNKFKNFEVFNATFSPCPEICNYVDAIIKNISKNITILNIPSFIIKIILILISPVTKAINSKSNYNYYRLNKSFFNNFVSPDFLIKKKYIFRYNIQKSMNDWLKSYRKDWM